MNKCGEFIEELESETVKSFLGGRNSPGIYIPSYQRRFSWGKTEFTRFFEDLACEISDETQTSYCTLFGNIVCFNDPHKKHLEDGIKREQPETLYNIVDGQQRISFIVLLAISLHQYIVKNGSKCQDNHELASLVSGLRNDLENIFSVHLEDRKRPKVIRALEDVWGEEGAENYSSPIARYTKQYIDDCVVGGGTFDYSTTALNESEKERHDKFRKNMKVLDSLVSKFCLQKSDTDAMALPSVERIIGNKALMKKLFDTNVEKIEYRSQDFPVFRAVLLGSYIRESVCLLVLKIKEHYDKSFAVFSAINTAGKLLNAFEAFVPEVVRFESDEMGNYRKSDSYKAYISKINKDLEDMGPNEDAADKHVAELMVVFALSYSGTQLPKKFYNQQKYLKERFNELQSPKEKRTFIKFMRYVHEAKKLFDNKKVAVTDITGTKTLSNHLKQEVEEAVFCLKFLRSSNFSLSIAIFARYLYNMHMLKLSDESVRLFCSAVKKAAAFCSMWRAASQTSTSGIDSEIRNLPIMGYGALAQSGEFILEEEELAKSLRNPIAHRYDISSRNDWKNLVNHVEITTSVARFLLLVGSNNKTITRDLEVKKLRDSKAHRTIAEDTFNHAAYETIEHIIPVNEQGKETSGLATPIKNQLWNLTLLPRNVNSALGNEPWRVKQKQYEVFSSETEDEYERHLGELGELIGRGPRLYQDGGPQYAFSLKTRYLAFLEDAQYDQEKGLDITNEILMFCWETLAEEWLNWPSKSNS